jgi:hypothetical protein
MLYALAVAGLYLASFEVDLTGMLSVAEDLFNSLFPAFVVIIGITLALGLIGMVVSEIRKAVTSRK